MSAAGDASAERLLASFGRLVGRSRQVLLSRLVEGFSREQLSASLAISIEASDVLLFRALGELRWALSAAAHVPPPVESLAEADERLAASSLAAALAGGLPPESAPQVQERAALALSVRAAAPELAAALLPPAGPPPSRRERLWDGARRLAWLAFVVAAAVLYSRWSAR